VGKGVGRIYPTLRYSGSFDLESSDEFVARWTSGDASARQEFSAILAKAELTMNEVMAEGFAEVIDIFQSTDRMHATAEARRNNALREIDRHRDVLGAAMRRAVDQVEGDESSQDFDTGSAPGPVS
jgi:hypothetical protein